MEQKINILLILRNENCLTEVIDFLLNSGVALDEKNVEEYAFIGGPPTVIKGHGLDTLRVYFVMKSLDTIKSDINNTPSMCHYDAVVMSLSNEADAELILDFIRSLTNSDNLIIIENLDEAKKTNLKNLGKVKSVDLSRYYESSEWKWRRLIANNWSTHLQHPHCLWNHITKCYNWHTTISYNSEIMLRSIISVFDFFYHLMMTIHSNIDVIAEGTETNSMYLIILTSEGDSYIQQRKRAKELLIQLNLLNVSDFDSLLKKEMKQLAYHLSRLAILCQEIVNFTGDLHSQLFHNFSGLKKFEKIYYNELQGVNRENLTETLLESVDTMSEMMYTGKYIKNVLGIEKLNALKVFLRRPHTLRLIDSLSVPTTIVDNRLGNEEKQDIQHKKRVENIDVENRIGNIQLLKSLQNAFQEVTEELKDMRQLQEQHTKDNREIKEKLSNLEQDNRELKEHLCNMNQNTRKLKEKLDVLEQKLDKASMKSLK